LDLISFISTQI